MILRDGRIVLRVYDVAPESVVETSYEAYPSASAHDLDVATVASYASALCDVVAARRREVDVRLDQMLDAREDADRAVAELREACDLAERYATFAARARAGDVNEITLIQAAQAIRSLLDEGSAA